MNHNCRAQYEIDIYGVPPKIGQYILSFGWLLTKIRFSANHHWYFCFNDTVHDITAILLLCCMQHACTCASCDRWKLYPCFRFSKNPSFTANPSSGTLELHSLNEVTEWKAYFWVYTIGTWSLLLASFRVGNLLCNQKSEITLKQCCSQPSLVAAQDDANFLDWVPFSWMKILQLPSWIRQNLVS